MGYINESKRELFYKYDHQTSKNHEYQFFLVSLKYILLSYLFLKIYVHPNFNQPLEKNKTLVLYTFLVSIICFCINFHGVTCRTLVFLLLSKGLN